MSAVTNSPPRTQSPNYAPSYKQVSLHDLTVADKLLKRWQDHWPPPPPLTVSQWADQYRKLGPASAEPGQWRTERAEYLRGIMDAATDPRVETLVLMCASQVGKTEAINNLIGYHIHYDPSPMLVIHPTLQMGEDWSKAKLAPMLEDTPVLKAQMAPVRGRASGNTLLQKQMASGHHLTIAGANSAASLASRAIRILCCDEVDRYPPSAGTEGDPVALAEKRTITFWDRKIVLVSTPTNEGASRIQKAYLESDQRRFWVPCPYCHHEQVLKWERVQWRDKDASTAIYECEGCEAQWNDAVRCAAIRRGFWRASEPFKRTAGFHLSQLYSPWQTLEQTVSEYLKREKDPEQLKTFVNTALGELWHIKGEAPDWRRLYDRREDYRAGIVPRDVVFLTAGLDVQKLRVEIVVWGWGRDKQCWLVDHAVIPSDPYLVQTWDAASEFVQRSWQHETGAQMRLLAVGADIGYGAGPVEQWARRHPGLVIPVKGAKALSAPIFAWTTSRDVANVGGTRRKGMRHANVGGHLANLELYGYLGLDAPTDEELDAGASYAPGFVHLNRGIADEEFCKQLVAETWLPQSGKWYRSHANEALDCWKYARAMFSARGADRWTKGKWEQERAKIDSAILDPNDARVDADVRDRAVGNARQESRAPDSAIAQQPVPPPPTRRPTRSSYMQRLWG